MVLQEFNNHLKLANCTKKAFARLVGKDASTVSRWGAGGIHGLPVPQYAQVTLHALIKLPPNERKALLIAFSGGNK